MKIVKDWIFALMVCRKYGLVWNPWCKLSYGSYNFYKGVINLNPFSKNFRDIFLHEIGHHVDDKRVNYREYFKYGTNITYIDNNRCIFDVLDSEYNASKFAIRCGGDRKYLLSQFNTYTASVMRERSDLERPIFECYLKLVTKLSKYFYTGL